MNTTIILPDANQPRIAHILAKDKYTIKYISKEQIMAEIANLYDAAQKANANLRPMVGLDSKDKAGLLNIYEDFYQECVKYNEVLLSDRQIKLHQPVVKNAARAARLRDAEERFTRYSDELAKREAGDAMGLDAKGQKHRIASLKRKIARAEASLKKLQKNS